MKTRLTKSVAIIFMVLTLGACAPGLGKDIPTYRITPQKLEPRYEQRLSKVQVRVGRFDDRRGDPAVGQINGRTIAPSDSVGASVQQALEKQLKQSGASVSLFDGPTITGEILLWSFKVNPKFPATEMVCEAKVRMHVSDSSGKSLYSAWYSGNIETKHPFMDEDKVQIGLGNAMSYAITEGLRDERFLAALESSGGKLEY